MSYHIMYQITYDTYLDIKLEIIDRKMKIIFPINRQKVKKL
jgi:hypothetical protein